jgi:hypothetical protein
MVLFHVSPPVILAKAEHSKAIEMHQWQNMNVSSLPAFEEGVIEWPRIPVLMALQCKSNMQFMGADTKSNKIQCDFSNCMSFDGHLLDRCTFEVMQDASFQLFAFKSKLNQKYLTPSAKQSGEIVFSEQLRPECFFSLVWHHTNLISLRTYHGTYLMVKKVSSASNANQFALFHEGSEWRSPRSAFLLHTHQNNNRSANIPRPQLPMRVIDGQSNLKCDIWLKSRLPEAQYLVFRSPFKTFNFRMEASSNIMGNWETITFAHDSKRNSDEMCVVSLFTKNGQILSCTLDGKHLEYLVQHNQEIDEERCRWHIFFHSYSVISIRNLFSKAWLILVKNLELNVYILSLDCPKMNSISDIENANAFKKQNCQFEICPHANERSVNERNHLRLQQRQRGIYHGNTSGLNSNTNSKSSAVYAM